MFLRPAKELQAGSGFNLRIRSSDADEKVAATFTAGDRRFEPEAQLEPKIDYLAVRDATCKSAECIGLAELRVSIGSSPPRPLFLRLESGADDDGANDWVFWPDGWFKDSIAEPESRWTTQRPVLLAPNDDCVDISVYGVEGRPLYHQSHCEPNRCAVSDGEAPNTCGGPPSSGIEVTQMPEGNCENRAAAGAVSGAVATHDSNDVVPAAAGERARQSHSGGCGVLRATTCPLLQLTVGLIACAWVLRTRRRKARSFNLWR